MSTDWKYSNIGVDEEVESRDDVWDVEEVVLRFAADRRGLTICRLFFTS